MINVRKITAIAAAFVITAGCALHQAMDPETRRALRVHAASVDDLTFQIITVDSGVEPNFDEAWTSWGAWGTTAGETTTLPGQTNITNISQPSEPTKPYNYAILKSCDSYAAGALEIPSEYEGIPVKVIEAHAFDHNCYDLTIITVPDSVAAIREKAFHGCSGLKEITLSSNLHFISEGLLSECSSLVQISIPDGVTAIGGGAFSGCSSLKAISIPDSVTQICYHYQTINDLFDGCTNLESITFPKSLEEIPAYTCSGCTSLKKITLPENLKVIQKHTFDGCSSLTEISLPDSVTVLADEAFYNCTGLTQIDLSENVTSIRKDAFRGCTALEIITIRNPECVISGLGASPVIYGAWGSTAETYASENGLEFRPLDDAPQPPEQPEDTLPQAPEGSIFCDADGDGDISVADAQYVLSFYVDRMVGNNPSWFEITGNPNAPV